MRPDEARVFIIEDTEKKLARLTTFVETTGGSVVGSVDNELDAHNLVKDPAFPENAANANVVLIDGNLYEGGGHGSDGMYIFLEGYKRAVLHRVDSPETIGAVAIGSSIDNDSEVAYATGGNFTDEYKEDAVGRWAALLEQHPAEPEYLTPGTMERIKWSGHRFREMMGRMFKFDYPDEPDFDQRIEIRSLRVKETKTVEDETVSIYDNELDEPMDVTLKDFAELTDEWAKWQDVDDAGHVLSDAHTVEALLRAGDYFYVIAHRNRVVDTYYGKDIRAGGETNQIAVSALKDIPNSYWEAVEFERPELELPEPKDVTEERLEQIKAILESIADPLLSEEEVAALSASGDHGIQRAEMDQYEDVAHFRAGSNNFFLNVSALEETEGWYTHHRRKAVQRFEILNPEFATTVTEQLQGLHPRLYDDTKWELLFEVYKQISQLVDVNDPHIMKDGRVDSWNLCR